MIPPCYHLKLTTTHFEKTYTHKKPFIPSHCCTWETRGHTKITSSSCKRLKRKWRCLDSNNLFKGMNQENKGMCSNNKTSNGSTTTTTEAKYSKRRRQVVMRRQRWSKRRNFLEGSRRGMNGKVRTLKKLVPNGKSMCLDGLFRETADYILGLEMQVKVMQILVEVLSGTGSKE